MPLSRITSASIANSAISAADIADGTITAAKIISVANTQITGNIVSSQIAPNQTLNGNVAIGTATTPTAKLWVDSGRVGLTNTYKLGWHSNPAHGDLGNYITGDDNINYVAIGTSGVEQLRVDVTGLLKFNSGYGSVATAYGCRAWVNFNGTGTVAIRASGNVSSITDNGTGDYTVNFTTAMVDANYSVNMSGGNAGANAVYVPYLDDGTTVPTSAAFRMSSSARDHTRNLISVFR